MRIHTKYSPVFATLGETPLLQEGNHGVQKAADVNQHPEPKNPNFEQADVQPNFHEIVHSINAIVDDHNSFVLAAFCRRLQVRFPAV